MSLNRVREENRILRDALDDCEKRARNIKSYITQAGHGLAGALVDVDGQAEMIAERVRNAKRSADEIRRGGPRG